MSPFIYLLVVSVVAAVGAFAMQRRSQERDESPETQKMDLEKQRQFEEMLQAGESFLAFCSAEPTSTYYFAVTDRRMILETKDGIVELPRDQIKKIKFLSFTGNKLRINKEGAMRFQIKAGKKYTVFRYSEKFVEVVQALVGLGY